MGWMGAEGLATIASNAARVQCCTGRRWRDEVELEAMRSALIATALP